uniref:LOV domain-containing protein n=1 Tax=Mantoniella antarctica TaxID=81844 RepID=A0A6U3KXH3_9CHLO|mmetsp:Transcript_9750/g.24083  ORF Transcript_9750/g.24083 Transcript_9750/m.24083 type:complete len:1153 (+) Transcript_9750:258-3716(+)|eukprot:CAMPEP_0181357922 /NCGR_PEP_ID=MMETSP1106-20121128/5226_1 /TAXON_ID=81844 /ORGANISM="Mantoniella antarctica, Strain SL-175" /LENGTH=1152 /DNA_ID=CAMNT_0023470831 /DNA_START=237 /DNA_END=3695 /DNA_ORIENTATION=+
MGVDTAPQGYAHGGERRSKRRRTTKEEEPEDVPLNGGGPALAAIQEELRTVKRNEKRLQQSLTELQHHLSEERVRVAELRAQLTGRSERGVGKVPSGRSRLSDLNGDGAGSADPDPSPPPHPLQAGFDAMKSTFDQLAAAGRPDNVLGGHPAAVVGGGVRRRRDASVSLGSGSDDLSALSGEIASRVLGSHSGSREELPMSMAALKELAMDSVQEGVTIADFSLPDQPLIYANHGFELITGYSREETIGHNCRFLQGLDTEPEKLAHIKQSIRAGLSCTVQIKNYRKNGTLFVNHLSLTPIRTAAGRVTHYVGIQSDITELVNTRYAELDALKKATVAEAATDAKSKFLAHMSHEIRTPLNGLIAVGQLLEDTSLNRMQRDFVSTICSSGETLQALISDILDFSQVEADKLVLRAEPFHPQAVMATVMKIVGLHASRLKLNVGYHVDAGVPEVVVGDAMRVQQVLLNTLNNAIKFTEKGDIMIRLCVGRPGEADAAANRASEAQAKMEKETTLAAEGNWREAATGAGKTRRAAKTDWLETPDKAAVRGSPERTQSGPEGSSSGRGETDDGGGSVLHFYIKDTGIGLDNTNIKPIFNSFQQVDSSPTRKYDGTGLGLAISQRLCEAMGGRMWAESPGLGLGSTFHFSIRCDAVQHATAEMNTDACVGGGVVAGAQADPVRADPVDAGKEAAARRRMQASGANTGGPFKSLVHTPSAINSETICSGHELRVLLYDESGMVRQTLQSAIKRWGAVVTAVASADEVVNALNEGVPASPGIEGGAYSVVVAEKSATFIKAIRQWTSAHGKLMSKSPEARSGGGSMGGSEDDEYGSGDGPEVSTENNSNNNSNVHEPACPFHCPAFILMTWPSFACSSDDLNSWGDIGRSSWDSGASPSGGSGGTGGESAGGSNEGDEEVEDFFSSNEAELLPKPVQHARLQKLLATSAAERFSRGETQYRPRRRKESNTPSLRGNTPSAVEPASSADRGDHNLQPIPAGGGAIMSNFMPQLPQPRNIRILLAEDHFVNMKVACAVLARCGHKDVTLAKDGVVVLEKLAALPSGLDAFDIVLMDLHMPRLGGLECVRQMRLLYPDSRTPIVAVTADAVEESRERCLSNGFNAWMSKPFRVEQLEGLLDEFCGCVPGSGGTGIGKAGGG